MKLSIAAAPPVSDAAPVSEVRIRVAPRVAVQTTRAKRRAKEASERIDAVLAKRSA